LASSIAVQVLDDSAPLCPVPVDCEAAAVVEVGDVTLKGFAVELADPDVADDVIFDSSDDNRSAAPVAAAPMVVNISKLPALRAWRGLHFS
jgi:hypothetical protein